MPSTDMLSQRDPIDLIVQCNYCKAQFYRYDNYCLRCGQKLGNATMQLTAENKKTVFEAKSSPEYAPQEPTHSFNLPTQPQLAAANAGPQYAPMATRQVPPYPPQANNNVPLNPEQQGVPLAAPRPNNHQMQPPASARSQTAVIVALAVIVVALVAVLAFVLTNNKNTATPTSPVADNLTVIVATQSAAATTTTAATTTNKATTTKSATTAVQTTKPVVTTTAPSNHQPTTNRGTVTVVTTIATSSAVTTGNNNTTSAATTAPTTTSNTATTTSTDTPSATDTGASGTISPTLSKTITETDNTKGINQVAFSPDGNYLATADSDGTGKVRIWGVITPTNTPTILTTAPSTTVQAIAFSADGKYLAVGTYNKKVYLWVRTPQGEFTDTSKQPFSVGDAVNSLAFSSQGNYLVSGEDGGEISIFQLREQSANKFSTIHSEQSAIEAVAFITQTDNFVSGNYDGDIFEWNNIDNPQAQGTKIADQFAGGVWSLSVSSDGNTLAVGSNKTNQFSLIDVNPTSSDSSSNIEKFQTSGNQVSVAFSPDSKYLAVANNVAINSGNISIYKISGGYKQPKSFKSAKISDIHDIIFSPDSKALAVVGNSQYIEIWNIGNKSDGGSN